MREPAESCHTTSAPAASPMETVENDIRLLREETEKIINSKDLTPQSLELYDLRRRAIFNRLRSALRNGDCWGHDLQSLMSEILEQDCVLLQKLEKNISVYAKGYFRLKRSGA